MRALLCLLMLMLLPSGTLFADDFSALTRTEDVKLRIASYNIFFSSVFPADDGGDSGNQYDRVDSFARIVKAMDADILALQEVFHAPPYFLIKTPGGILAHMKEITGEDWHLSHDHSWTPEDPPTGKTGNAGRFIFSRYPILWEYDGINRFNAALIDLPASVSDRDVLVIDVHYSNHEQATKTGEFLAKVAAGKISKVPADVMIMVCGDFNNQEGQARYNDVFKSIPDQIDLRPTHLGWPEPNHTTIGSTIFDADLKPIDIYTKTDDAGEILRKRIDFMFWRSDRLEVKHAHILNPMIMDRTALKTYGLKRVDTALNPAAGIKPNTRADHWPYFADFVAPGGGTVVPK